MKNFGALFNMDMSPEAVKARRMKNYEETKLNPENMSNWLPKIESVNINTGHVLQMPDTKIVPLTFEQWYWLTSDGYTPEAIDKFDGELKDSLGDFILNKGDFFMKSGVFSNKFTFLDTQITHRSNIGQQFLSIFYQSMVFGASNTSEVVVRKQIQDKDHRATIYEGMPLKTEFRVFYDFDNEEAIGVSNYWHPDLMEKNLQDNDLEKYVFEKGIICSEFDEFKNFVSDQVKIAMKGNKELTGKWSVDVMKNADEFWLIDMARMEVSALVPQMETLD